MTFTPTAHLLLDTSSSNEDYNGDCDYCLVPLQPEYVSYLLTWMDDVIHLHQVDNTVNIIECWDYRPEYVTSGEKVDGLTRAGLHLSADPAQGDPVLLAGDLPLDEVNVQGVETTPT